jgi:hypothetical protein
MLKNCGKDAGRYGPASFNPEALVRFRLEEFDGVILKGVELARRIAAR